MRRTEFVSVALGVTLTLVFAAVLVIGVMDYQDELAEYEHTCDMIEAGAWPAEVEPSCGEREP